MSSGLSILQDAVGRTETVRTIGAVQRRTSPPGGDKELGRCSGRRRRLAEDDAKPRFMPPPGSSQ